MATLKPEHQKFLLLRYAMYYRNNDVMEAFEEEFGFSLQKEQIVRYNAGNERSRLRLGKTNIKLFDDTRKAFITEQMKAPTSERAYRLMKLDQMFHDLLDKKKIIEAAQILEQVAKESGDSFTNKKIVDGTVKHEGEVTFTADENRALLADAMKKAADMVANPTEH